MSRLTLLALLFAVSTPALAQGPATTVKVQTAPRPTAGTDFRKIINDNLDFISAQCRKEGGGMISDENGAYQCVDPAGNDLWD